MEENNKRNQLREARLKLEKTRKNLMRVEREQRQILKSKARLSVEEVKENQVKNSRLNFGLKFWATYRGHEYQDIAGIIWNGNSK